MLQVAKEVRNLKHDACIQQSKLANLPTCQARPQDLYIDTFWMDRLCSLLEGQTTSTTTKQLDGSESETQPPGSRKNMKNHLSIRILYPALYAVAMPSWGPWCSQLAGWFLHMRHLNGSKQPSMHNPNHPGATQVLSCQHILHWVSPLWWPGNVKSRKCKSSKSVDVFQPRTPSHPSVPSAGQISALAGAARCHVKQVTCPQVILNVTTSIVKCMSNLKMIPNVTIKLSMPN